MTGNPEKSVRFGLLNGAGAFVLWGICPFYFVLLSHVAPLEVLIHRILWSVLLLLGIIILQGKLRETLAEFTRPKRLLTPTKLVSFSLVWLGLAVLIFGAVRGRLRRRIQG
jgi:chloramphenicol-sensitive protein RarD